jgi:hypothetical protein
MSQKCNASTVKGQPCRNGLGCPHHVKHCREVIRSRARAREEGPVQLTLWVRDWEEARGIMMRAYLMEKARNSRGCGCLG